MKTFLPLVMVLVQAPLLSAGETAIQKMVPEPVFGGEMLVREAGQKNPEMVLLVHGLGDEAGTTWDGIIGDLALHYHVVAPDLPGFGKSSKGNHLYSPAAYAQALNILVMSMPAKPLYLVGHSMGGGISLVYAALYGRDLKRLVIVDSVGVLHRLAVSQYHTKEQINQNLPFIPSGIGNTLGRFSDLLLEKSSRLPVDPDVALNSETMRKEALGANPTRIAALALVQTDYSLMLGRITTPTWLLWGDKDKVAPMRMARVLQWNLPRTELTLFSGQGHCPMLEDAQGFLAVLARALSTLPHGLERVMQKDQTQDLSCSNKNGQILQGSYGTIRITGCKNIRLVNIAAQHIEIRQSEVEIMHADITAQGEQPAIRVQQSRLSVTGADIHGHTGIVTNQSRLDLAGVRFMETPTAIRAEGNDSALLSSSSVKQFAGKTTAIHISCPLKAKETL
ncbi:alpha/beta fold hydrolase [uncultured Desulfobacter sp.]|uniref:alpha/beta fold hydrolase n=1 Tax=uncultured Desulfobacter sp. TaxID=240139 RepID=UPI0037489E37